MAVVDRDRTPLLSSNHSGRGTAFEHARPVAYKTKTEAAYAELRRRIMRGILVPMAPINQEEIARSLGVSTTPLREALRRLESEGLVVSNAHRDATVAPLDLDQLMDLYDTKVELECYAVRLAAHRFTDDDAEAMLTAVARGPVENASEDEVWAANRVVHTLFCGVCHNPVLTEFLDTVWDRFERYRSIVDAVVLDPEVDREHALIVAAIINRDAERAITEMRNHSLHGRGAIEAALAAQQ
jgi:DNA-binding GntR family transcriptional regulator